MNRESKKHSALDECSMGRSMTGRSMSRHMTLTSRLGPPTFLICLLLFAAAACGDPGVAGEVTPQPSATGGFRSLAVSPDERVSLASGLSAVLPDHLAGSLNCGAGLPDMYAELLLTEREAVPDRLQGVVLLTLENEAQEMPQLVRFSETAEVVAQGGHVAVLWGPWENQRWLMVVTRLPGRPTGVLWQQFSTAGDAAEARAEARELWRQFSVRGASLPAW